MLGIFTSALTLVIGFALGLIALISTSLASLSAGILHWVTSGNFITLSYTNAGVLPSDPRFNEFVSMGWELTRGLTNIIFVVAMIAIGLGTALGRAEYQAKKALPTLIIIALLINFTPVLLGIVIDASNIVMNYFLSAVGGFDFFMNNMGATLNLISTSLGKFFDPSAQLNLVVGLLVMIVFSILAGIVFFLFSLLFIGRFIALWLLVILSPFALACYILPVTRKYYTQWLNQLIQWLMIGITGGFFLYLASKMIEISSKVKIAETSGALGAIFGANIANQILPWGISLALMFIGLSAGLTTGAIGANLAINWGKKLPGNFAKSRLGGKVSGIGASLGAKTLKGIATISPGLKKLEGIAGKVPVIGKELNWATKISTRPLGWMAKGANEAISPRLIEYAATKRKVPTPKGWDQMSITEKESYIRAQTFGADKLTLSSKMKSEGTFQNSTDNFQKEIVNNAKNLASNIIYKKEVGDILDAIPNEVTKDIILKYRLAGKKDLAEIANTKATLDADINEIITELGLTGTDRENQATKILHMQGLKPKDLTELSKASLKSTNFQLAMRKMGSKHLETLQNSFDGETLRTILDTGEGLNTIDKPEYLIIKAKNEKLTKWANENPAGKEMLNWSEKFKPVPPPPPPKPIVIPPRQFTETEFAERQLMQNETKNMRKRLKSIIKKPQAARTKEEIEEIKLIENAIKDIKNRLKT